MSSVPARDSGEKKCSLGGKVLPFKDEPLFPSTGNGFSEIEQLRLQSAGWTPARMLAAGVIIAAYSPCVARHKRLFLRAGTRVSWMRFGNIDVVY
jgi:hypothetical protein